MELPNFKAIFLQALDYPEFARPEFYRKEQEKSGWSIETFYQGMNEAFHHYHILLSEQSGMELIKLKRLCESEPDVNRLLWFKIDEQDIQHENRKIKLPHRVLLNLENACQLAKKGSLPLPHYSDLTILHFAELSLQFIEKTYKNQLVKKQLEFVEKPDNKSTKYLLYDYHIVTDDPIFKFTIFKEAVRNLLLNSLNTSEIKGILESIYQTAAKIVEIWNGRLYDIENSPKPLLIETTSQTSLLVYFENNDKGFTTVLNPSMEDLQRLPYKYYNNDGFASYGLTIANFLSKILSKNSSKDIKKKTLKVPSLKALLNDDEAKISIIQTAIRDLNISKLLTDRELTGFIEGCKAAGALPNINNTDLFKTISIHLNKELRPNSKPRGADKNYEQFLKETKRYFGV